MTTSTEYLRPTIDGDNNPDHETVALHEVDEAAKSPRTIGHQALSAIEFSEEDPTLRIHALPETD